MSEHLYVTTTIPYVNAPPHIGHALELVQADAFARYHRLRGASVRLQTGTDENAFKNVLGARAQGLPVRELVDSWRETRVRAEVARTTETSSSRSPRRGSASPTPGRPAASGDRSPASFTWSERTSGSSTRCIGPRCCSPRGSNSPTRSSCTAFSPRKGARSASRAGTRRIPSNNTSSASVRIPCATSSSGTYARTTTRTSPSRGSRRHTRANSRTASATSAAD